MTAVAQSQTARLTASILSPSVAYPIGAMAATIAIWELLVRTLHVPEFILPAPTQVMAVFISGRLPIFGHMVLTVIEILFGFLGGALLGVGLAMLVTLSRPFAQSIYPLLVASQAVPKLAIAPLFVIWLGFGIETRIVIAVLISFFPILIDTVTGLRSVPVEIVYVARSMGVTRTQLFRHFVLPHALPMIFSGLKVGITLAVSGAIVAEFVGADKGLGYLILAATGRLQTDVVFAAILLLALIGIVLFYLLLLAERLALPWHVSARDRGASGGF